MAPRSLRSALVGAVACVAAVALQGCFGGSPEADCHDHSHDHGHSHAHDHQTPECEEAVAAAKVACGVPDDVDEAPQDQSLPSKSVAIESESMKAVQGSVEDMSTASLSVVQVDHVPETLSDHAGSDADVSSMGEPAGRGAPPPPASSKPPPPPAPKVKAPLTTPAPTPSPAPAPTPSPVKAPLTTQPPATTKEVAAKKDDEEPDDKAAPGGQSPKPKKKSNNRNRGGKKKNAGAEACIAEHLANHAAGLFPAPRQGALLPAALLASAAAALLAVFVARSRKRRALAAAREALVPSLELRAQGGFA